MKTLQRMACGVLLGFVNGKHCRCVLAPGHDGPHIDRNQNWWT